MSEKPIYGQFCPVSVASEVIAEKWTPLVLRELLCGSHRFSDLQRGVPLMSASLLSQRLKHLEEWGLVERRPQAGGRGHTYHLTEAGAALGPIINSIGLWGLKYMRGTFAERNLDPGLLMWDMRRWIRPDLFPAERAVIMFVMTDTRQRERTYWLVKDVKTAVLDLCLENPGFDVDLTIRTDVESLARVWLGDIGVESAVKSGKIELEGSSSLRLSFYDWIGLSPFAHMRPDPPIPGQDRLVTHAIAAAP